MTCFLAHSLPLVSQGDDLDDITISSPVQDELDLKASATVAGAVPGASSTTSIDVKDALPDKTEGATVATVSGMVPGVTSGTTVELTSPSDPPTKPTTEDPASCCGVRTVLAVLTGLLILGAAGYVYVFVLAGGASILTCWSSLRSRWGHHRHPLATRR